jgi:hypothetical protein
METAALRPGNKALDYIVNNSSDRGEKFAYLVRYLPDFAALLSREAKKASEALLQCDNPQESIDQVFPDKSGVLGDCVFDLMLVPCFGEIARYCGDNELASVFVDALLYQSTVANRDFQQSHRFATGEPSAYAELQNIRLRTDTSRVSQIWKDGFSVRSTLRSLKAMPRILRESWPWHPSRWPTGNAQSGM